MCTIFKKLTIVYYERVYAKKKTECVGEKDNNWQSFVTRER